MKIQGNLATYEFSDLLQWLAQGNKTGMLNVTDGDVEYRLGFDHGRIDMSSSSDPSQRLDSYLYGKGVIDQATLARAERLREATKMMSGQVLVTLGAVTELQLAQALREKTEEILCELLTWDRGTFEFVGGDRPEATMVPISLEVTKLLLESMHRLDQQRGGQAEPTTVATPAATEAARPAVSPDATQAIEGLALAEVMDPEAAPAMAPPPPSAPSAPEAEEAADAEMPVHYAVMAQGPGPLRRLLPYAAVGALSLVVATFYVANRDATAQAADAAPTGEPILFTRTVGPEPARAAVVAPAAATTAAVEAPAATDVSLEQAEQALRERYEGQLADLRRELEEARRQAPPTAPSARSASTRPAQPDLPADSMMRAAFARELPAPTPVAVPPERPPAPAPAPEAEIPTPEPSDPEPAPAAPPQAIDAEPAVASAPAVRIMPPKLLSRPTPRYPVAALRVGRSATLTVRVLVGPDGKVVEVERVGPKAGLGFDRAAEDAARRSTWQPGTRGGEAAEMWADLRFEFKL